jgi:hypothetical protein
MGGSFAPVWVAAFTWNGWQASAEYALRDFLRPLIQRIDLLFDKQRLNIRCSLKEFERKTVVVFKSGKSVVFEVDELPGVDA